MDISNEETMLYRYACRNGFGWPFYSEGRTLDEVTKHALAHVQEVHADDLYSIIHRRRRTDGDALARSGGLWCRD